MSYHGRLFGPECKDTHFVLDMELARPVEVEDGVEGARMPAHQGETIWTFLKKIKKANPVMGAYTNSDKFSVEA